MIWLVAIRIIELVTGVEPAFPITQFIADYNPLGSTRGDYFEFHIGGVPLTEGLWAIKEVVRNPTIQNGKLLQWDGAEIPIVETPVKASGSHALIFEWDTAHDYEMETYAVLIDSLDTTGGGAYDVAGGGAYDAGVGRSVPCDKAHPFAPYVREAWNSTDDDYQIVFLDWTKLIK
jgi:hypothetical protein